MGVDIRPAREEDQAAITAMIRRARLNPADLQWPRFLVAEQGGQIVGVAQVRVHPDGARELASLAVAPASRGNGVATRLVDALLRDQTTDVYTLIDRPFVDHFRRWGFERIDAARLPRSVRHVHRIGRIVTALASVLVRRRIRIVPLRRAGLADPM
jgi:N-acetylglutamate synthase-like GNAT family acetyltransferase